MSFTRFGRFLIINTRTVYPGKAGNYIIVNTLSRSRRTLILVLAVLLSAVFCGMPIAARAAETSGYVSSLEQDGFPAAYAQKLAPIKANHPNWRFVPYDTGLDWNTALSSETSGHKNTVYINAGGSSATRLYRDQSSGSYQAKNGFPYTYIVRDGSDAQSRGWIDASKMAVSYYMNPLTFIGNEVTLLQFESLNWSFSDDADGNREAYTAVEASIRNSFMSSSSNAYNGSYITSDGNIIYLDTSGNVQTLNMTYATAICGAAKAYDLDPCYLASKIVGEVGAKGSGSVSGNYNGYVGYYNYLNIGASDNSSGEAIVNGLAYAKRMNWTNPVASIYGAAKIISESYVSAGQNTAYFQKFNVTDRNTYSHQYMTAVNGVVNTTYMTYYGYKQGGLLDRHRTFIIPVFRSMPSGTGTYLKLNTNSGSGTVNHTANVRSSPSITGSVLTQAGQGSQVTVLGGYRDTKVTYDSNYRYNATQYRMFQPLWYRVRLSNGTVGYILEDYVDVSASASISGSRSLRLNVSVSGGETPSYMSLDTRVATVSKDGVVTGRGTGTTKIVAYLTNGCFDVITVRVNSGQFEQAVEEIVPRVNVNRSSNTSSSSSSRQTSRPSSSSRNTNRNTGTSTGGQRPDNVSGLLRALQSIFA